MLTLVLQLYPSEAQHAVLVETSLQWGCRRHRADCFCSENGKPRGSCVHPNGRASFMASSSTASTPGGQVQRLGHRPTLTTWDAIAQSLSIGPIFSSAF